MTCHRSGRGSEKSYSALFRITQNNRLWHLWPSNYVKTMWAHNKHICNILLLFTRGAEFKGTAVNNLLFNMEMNSFLRKSQNECRPRLWALSFLEVSCTNWASADIRNSKTGMFYWGKQIIIFSGKIIYKSWFIFGMMNKMITHSLQ